MPGIRDIFARHMDEYLARFGETMPPWHRRALRDVVDCRTPASLRHFSHLTFAFHPAVR